jgi:hypothetical protein
MVTLNVVDAGRLPLSNTSTQYVPGFAVTDICGVEPAAAVGRELDRLHVVPLGTPIPRPTVVEAVPTLVSVILTVPVCATVNANGREPFGANTPANVSVPPVVGVVVVVGEIAFDKRLHPPPAIATAIAMTTAHARM